MFYKGAITLPDHVDVTDPCYSKDVWCRKRIENLIPGEYGCFYSLSDEGDGGMRVSEIEIRKASQDNEKRAKEDIHPWEYVGHIGVDAGLAGFFNDKPDFDDTEWSNICNGIYPDEKSYRTKAWIMDFDGRDGFFSQSGYGDGCYPIDVLKDSNGKVYAVRIGFLDDID